MRPVNLVKRVNLTSIVAKWAKEAVAPKVLEMVFNYSRSSLTYQDEAEVMDPELIRGLFEQGVRSSPI